MLRVGQLSSAIRAIRIACSMICFGCEGNKGLDQFRLDASLPFVSERTITVAACRRQLGRARSYTDPRTRPFGDQAADALAGLLGNERWCNDVASPSRRMKGSGQAVPGWPCLVATVDCRAWPKFVEHFPQGIRSVAGIDLSWYTCHSVRCRAGCHVGICRSMSSKPNSMRREPVVVTIGLAPLRAIERRGGGGGSGWWWCMP